jgi:SAM-dependent methyltransferase
MQMKNTDNLDLKSIEKRLRENGPKNWYHNFEIIRNSNIFTNPGKPVTNVGQIFRSLGIKEGFWEGKRVLDIGAFSGAYSFYLEDLGAHVTAVDVQNPETNGFSIVHEIRKSDVEYIISSVYDINPEGFGHFDCVLFFGLFYHLKHPLLALERINSVCKASALLIGGGTTSDRWFHNRDESCKVGADFERITKEKINNKDVLAVNNLNELPLCGFSSVHFLGDYSNWFIPNNECLKDWLEVSGFKMNKVNPGSRAHSIPWMNTEAKLSYSVFLAKHFSEPVAEYEKKTYAGSRTKMDNNDSMYVFRIPTQSEVEKLRTENNQLREQLEILKTSNKESHDKKNN